MYVAVDIYSDLKCIPDIVCICVVGLFSNRIKSVRLQIVCAVRCYDCSTFCSPWAFGLYPFNLWFQISDFHAYKSTQEACNNKIACRYDYCTQQMIEIVLNRTHVILICSYACHSLLIFIFLRSQTKSKQQTRSVNKQIVFIDITSLVEAHLRVKSII